MAIRRRRRLTAVNSTLPRAYRITRRGRRTPHQRAAAFSPVYVPELDVMRRARTFRNDRRSRPPVVLRALLAALESQSARVSR